MVFKALRLVPDFDGNPHVLTRFIKLCDELVEEIGAGNRTNLIALLNGILNKVTGPAARLINSNGIPDDWDGIRQALINNFADQRDETALYNDLALLTQGNNSPQEFYEKCQSLFSTIMTYVSLHETVDTTVKSKRTLYQKLTLQAYLRGLKDPLGSRIRCMRPETIEKALEFVHEETNILYMQNRSQLAPDRKPQQSLQPPRYTQEFLMPYQPRSNTFNVPGASRAQPMFQPGQQYYKPHFGSFPQMNQAGPSRTQQMFGARPPSYNLQGNAFRPPTRIPLQQAYGAAPSPPRPMSGVSHFVPKNLPPSGFNPGHDWRKFGNPPPSNYFKTREMNMNECFEPTYDNYDFDQYQGYDMYNFHEQYYYDNDQIQYPEITYDNSDNATYPGPAATESEDFQKAPKSDKPK